MPNSTTESMTLHFEREAEDEQYAEEQARRVCDKPEGPLESRFHKCADGRILYYG